MVEAGGKTGVLAEGVLDGIRDSLARMEGRRETPLYFN